MMGRLPVLALAIVLAGCANGNEDAEVDVADDAHEVDEADGGVFSGTPVDYVEALAACYEDHGIATERNPDDPSNYTVHSGAMSREEIDQIDETCVEEIGQWTHQSVPEEYVERNYEHLLWQRDCLIDLGYDLAEPPSFEVYAERLEWDPLGEATRAAGLRAGEFLAVRDQCPYLTQWEAQQQRSD